MSYPGDPNLDQKIMQRILSAFGEAVRLYQEGNPEECRTILRSILEVDPSFAPGARLMQAVDDGSPVDLGQLLGDVGAAGGVDVEGALIQARQAFADRDYPRAQKLAAEILAELPGEEEARRLGDEAARRLRSAGDVEKYVASARQAMREGSVREVEAFLELARDLDPSHPGLAELEAELSGSSGGAGERPMEFEFLPGDAPAAAAAPPEELFTVEEDLEDSTLSRRGGAPAPAVPGDEEEALAETIVAPAAVRPTVPPPRPVVPAPEPPPVDTDVDAGARAAAGPPPVAAADASGFEFASDAGGAAEPGLGFAVDGGDARAAGSFGEGGEIDFGAEVPPEDEATRIQGLLEQGQVAFDAGDYQTAVDTWSRVYLIQADNQEADRRIEEARRRREEVERRADHTFFEAREAFEQGQTDTARRLCQEVLDLVPQHLEAHDLLTRLDTPAAPPPPPTAAPGDEDDLFRDDFVPVPATLEGGAAAAAAERAEPAARPGLKGLARARGRAPKRKLGVPVPVLALLGAVALLVLVVGFLLRSTLFGGAARAAESTLVQAEEAARQGRLQDAINLLRSLQAAEELEGSVANQVSQRIVEYQRQLKSRAVPTPEVKLEPIRAALAAGNRTQALRMVREGLAKIPGDPELATIEAEVEAYSPAVSTLAQAVEARDMDRVRAAAQAVLAQHPDDEEATRLWRAATFNQAVLMLRRYEVGTAKALLDALSGAGGDDADVQRIRDFAERYVSRPVDPRYQIFVTNVELRPLA